MAVVLVAEGVGQGLDRVRGGDDVAVAVEPGVDVDQPLSAVAGEDLHAHVAEDRTGDGDGAGDGRGEGWVAVVRGAAAPAPGQGRVQGVALEGQQLQDLEALLGLGHHGLVELPQPVEELLPGDLDGEALPGRQARGPAEGEGGGVAEARGAAADHLRLPAGPLGLVAVGAHVSSQGSVAVRSGGCHPPPRGAP
ncbi:hypothetical protein HC251_06025 [Iamia sp. SCSIO 61187]|uniref:hypothetical protein n=1 Tax=Iamia sp. SCSIO 61187 TaxID=2722752 RepID=UPI001C6307BC|nr:hypothetical protein [Iamia sp. SCSIO 61187]QYG92037.1 hypothetical protein HC251_06025 [Iamia sp. SCSIO 61187]